MVLDFGTDTSTRIPMEILGRESLAVGGPTHDLLIDEAKRANLSLILRFESPYEDAEFTAVELPALRTELEHLLENVHDEHVMDFARDLIEFTLWLEPRGLSLFAYGD